MATVDERGREVRRALTQGARWAAGAALWLARAAAAVAWLGVYALWRTLAAGKRVWFCAKLTVLAAVIGLYLANRPRVHPLASVLAIVFAFAAVHGSWPSWVEYRDKLIFLARARLDCRRLYAGADWRRVWRRRPWTSRDGLIAVGAVAAVGLLVHFWCSAGRAVHQDAAIVACAVAAVGFWYQAWIVWLLERAESVKFYHRGWPLGDPRRVEAVLARRCPGWAPFLRWRAKVSAACAPLADVLEKLLAAPGRCAG
jgi:hypothetical protein